MNPRIGPSSAAGPDAPARPSPAEDALRSAFEGHAPALFRFAMRP